MPYTAPTNPRQILTVTKLNRLARTLLESEMGLVWLSAEISNFVRASSGHWYFTLKDDKAQVRAAMFRNSNRLIRTSPKEGDKVLVRASVGIYEARGDYQLVVEHLEDDGEGQLKQAFDALKAKLLSQGLFDASRKRALPDVIKRLGVITSDKGAALHDVLSVLSRRSPATEVIIYPSMVQGETAAKQLIKQIEIANQRRECDVILLTRGGGSMEDLWCFNDEQLAYAIAQSAIPIVSAVGHEVDITIADFVADLRAPTPSAAAEMLSQDTTAQLLHIDNLVKRLQRSVDFYTQQASHNLQAKIRHLKALHPSLLIQSQQTDIARRRGALHSALTRILQQADYQHRTLHQRLHRVTPAISIEQKQDKLALTTTSLEKNIEFFIRSRQEKLGYLAHALQSVSPLATLSRGYSISFSEDKAITSVNQVNLEQTMTTRVADGEITSRIIATKTI